MRFAADLLDVFVENDRFGIGRGDGGGAVLLGQLSNRGGRRVVALFLLGANLLYLPVLAELAIDVAADRGQ